jgi:hypothetical protein
MMQRIRVRDIKLTHASWRAGGKQLGKGDARGEKHQGWLVDSYWLICSYWQHMLKSFSVHGAALRLPCAV